MFEKFFESRKAKRDEEYQRTLQAHERVGRAQEDLEKAVDDLENKVPLRIERNRIQSLIELEESKLKLATLKRDQQGIVGAEEKIQEYKKRLEEIG